MILDHLSNADRYIELHPLFKKAFAYLAGLDMSRLPVGKVEISGQQLFAIGVDAEGKGPSGATLETHHDYIDIQYQAGGTDCIGWASAKNGIAGKGYDSEKDVEFYDDPSNVWISVPAGHFAIFYPEDAHAPMGGQGRQTKVVVKVKTQAI